MQKLWTRLPRRNLLFRISRTKATTMKNLKLEDEPDGKLLEPFTGEWFHSLMKQASEKYHDFVMNVGDVNPADRKIFMCGWDAIVETLTNIFSKYDEIEDCKVVTDKVSGKSKGYTFILFKHMDDRRASRDFSRHILLQRRGGTRHWTNHPPRLGRRNQGYHHWRHGA